MVTAVPIAISGGPGRRSNTSRAAVTGIDAHRGPVDGQLRPGP